MPIVLPRIVVSQAYDDELSVVYEPNDTDLEQTMWVARADLSAVIDRLVEGAGSPVRLEVRTLDGAVYADILHRPPGERAHDSAIAPAADREVVRLDGFLPGEPVIVAAIVGGEHADAEGTVRVAGEDSEVLVVGEVSGRAVRHERT